MLGRPRFWWGQGVALSAAVTIAAPTVTSSSVVHARALMAKKRKKRKPRPGVTPAQAEANRKQVMAEVEPTLSADPRAAGAKYDEAAAKQGDPLLFVEAGSAYLLAARRERSPELAAAASERGKMAIDILFYHADSTADPRFRLIEMDDLGAGIARAKALVASCELLIQEIEQERLAAARAAAEQEEETEDETEPARPGRGLLIGGSVAMVVGVAGLGAGVAGLVVGSRRQTDVDDPTVFGEEYDELEQDGQRANALAISGFAIGGAAVVVGAVLLGVGARRRKQAKTEQTAGLRVGPALGRHGGGLTLRGRF